MRGRMPGSRRPARGRRPIRDLGLTIAGSPLEPILAEFDAELERAGLRRVRPQFYLSTEWGVPDGTIAIAIPFYLARPDLSALHAERDGPRRGASAGRHPPLPAARDGARRQLRLPALRDRGVGRAFGSMTQPYLEEYRPEPFSRRFVRHLPGWYAQKHPDEDWAETFAVWMTPGLDWRAEYADWPVALAKLQYCDRTMAALADHDPVVTADDLDEDVGDAGLLGRRALRDLAAGRTSRSRPASTGRCGRSSRTWATRRTRRPTRPAAAGLGPDPQARARPDRPTSSAGPATSPSGPAPCSATWPTGPTGSARSTPPTARPQAIVALTALVTALAMNHVHRGDYVP